MKDTVTSLFNLLVHTTTAGCKMTYYWRRLWYVLK